MTIISLINIIDHRWQLSQPVEYWSCHLSIGMGWNVFVWPSFVPLETMNKLPPSIPEQSLLLLLRRIHFGCGLSWLSIRGASENGVSSGSNKAAVQQMDGWMDRRINEWMNSSSEAAFSWRATEEEIPFHSVSICRLYSPLSNQQKCDNWSLIPNID